MWAFWRRIQYGVGYFLTLSLALVAGYYSWFYVPPNCFDNKMNGEELDIDCGGACTRICAMSVMSPTVLWAKSFPANAGEYNAVAYVENKNQFAGTPKLAYTFNLSDEAGLITSRSGVTVLPPGSIYPVFEGRINTSGRVPTMTSLSLMPVEMWLPDTFGRTQFKTSELELLGSDKRPRLNARVENAELTTAKNVEIIATIFDARGNPLTASQTFVDEFLPRSSKNITFTWPQPIAKTLRSCTVPTDVLLAIDLSGSMNNDGGTPPQPISAVLESAQAFVQTLNTGDQVGVITFASQATTNLPLTGSTTEASALLSGLKISPQEEKGSTNTGEALEQSLLEFASSRHNDNARKVVIILTDGLATAPGDDPSTVATDAAKALKDSGVSLFTIGLGASVDQAFLNSLASSPEQAFIAPSTSTLGNIYQSITGAICEEGAARIDVIPKTSSNFTQI